MLNTQEKIRLYEKYFVYLFRCLRITTYRKRLAIPKIESGQFNLNGKSDTLSLGYIWVLTHHIAESVSMPHSYSFKGSPEPDFKIRSKEAHAFFVLKNRRKGLTALNYFFNL